jgi:hypothetical protein
VERLRVLAESELAPRELEAQFARRDLVRPRGLRVRRGGLVQSPRAAMRVARREGAGRIGE